MLFKKKAKVQLEKFQIYTLVGFLALQVSLYFVLSLLWELRDGDSSDFQNSLLQSLEGSANLEFLSLCHCEGAKRPKQSRNSRISWLFTAAIASPKAAQIQNR